MQLGADGGYSYSLNNTSDAVQALGEGQTATDSFSYTVADSQGATATAQITINVAGADEEECGLTLIGTTKNDKLTGSDCVDVIDGRKGSDTMTGGKGDDIYFVDASGDKVIESSGGGNDSVATTVSYVLPQHVENAMLLGSAKLTATGNSADNVIVGNAGASTLNGGGGNDVLVGRAAADTLDGGTGNDRLYGEGGNDKLKGGAGNDIIWGGTGNDQIDGGGDNDTVAGGTGDDEICTSSGMDVIVAGAGNDSVSTGANSDFIDGGTGNDCIDAGSGTDFIAGGKGNDTILSGDGRDVISFNRGDGQDILTNSNDCTDARGDLISLGGGIRYADLTLQRSGQDLVLGLGSGDKITTKDWYASVNNRSIGALQVVTVGGDYDPLSIDALYNKKVAVFDFIPLAQQYDAARQANASLGAWAMAPALNSALIGVTDHFALGGDLAYRYATTYSATAGYGSDLDADAVREEASGASAVNWQTISTAPVPSSAVVDPWIALQAGTDLVVSQAPGASNPIEPTATPTTDSLVIAALSASATTVPTWANR